MTLRELLREVARNFSVSADNEVANAAMLSNVAWLHTRRRELLAAAARFDEEEARVQEGAANRDACAEFGMLPLLARLDADLGVIPLSGGSRAQKSESEVLEPQGAAVCKPWCGEDLRGNDEPCFCSGACDLAGRPLHPASIEPQGERGKR